MFNVGALTVVAGMLTTFWPAVVAGGVAVGWHAVVLLSRMRRALPSRFGVTVRYYVVAAALLPVGITVGVFLARGNLHEGAHARLALAHVTVNQLGWMGLTITGTLVTLWPTMLITERSAGTPVTPVRTESRGRRSPTSTRGSGIGDAATRGKGPVGAA